MKFKKTTFYLLIILLLTFFLRIIFLDRIPVGINNDELHFTLNAKSIFYKSVNIDNNLNPFHLFEASSVIFAPIIGFLPTSLLVTKIPYVLISVLSILLLYLITLNLTKNTTLALFVSLLTSLNPWSIYTSRTAFDAPIAIFFFLLTLYLMTKSKIRYLLLSIIPGYLAFNSYIGTKILYFPFILISSFYLWKFINKKFGKYYLLITIFSLLVTLNFAFSLKTQAVGNRVSELWTPNSPQIISQVNNERLESLRPAISLFTNKYTVYFRNTFEKYLNNFSPNILFLNGDSTFTGSLWIHGYFYYLDILLIIFGIIFLYQKNRPFLFFILSLILLSPLPEAIRSDLIPAYVFHSSFQYPFLFILLGAGALFILKLLPKKIFKMFFIILYLISFLNFLNIYFLKSPVYQPESFVFSHRLISRYLSMENKNNREVYFLTTEPEFMFKTYLFYTNSFTKENFDNIRSQYSSVDNVFNFEHLHFVNHQKYLPNNKNYTLVLNTNDFVVEDSGSKLFITDLSDARKIYSIYNGTSCQGFNLETFTHNLNISDMNIEKIDTDSFCRKFITF